MSSTKISVAVVDYRAKSLFPLFISFDTLDLDSNMIACD